MSGSCKVIVIGAGGHAKVLVDALLAQSCKIDGLIDAAPKTLDYNQVLGIPILGDDDIVMKMGPANVELVCGIGSIKATLARKNIFEKFRRNGFKFAHVVHPSAIIGNECTLGEGDQVMAGAVVQSGSFLGDGVIVNTGARIDHDSFLSDFVHVAPGATICGNVKVGECSHIGAGATVLQGITIGRECTVAAGAVVTRDVMDNLTVLGIPAADTIIRKEMI